MSDSTPSGRQRLRRSDGIAIGPILFVIAVLGILATVMASGMGTMSNTGITDRIAADIPSQANLIRTKILECYSKFGTDQNFDGYPNSGGAVVDVSTLTCTGDAATLGTSANLSLWSGPRPTTLPAPTSGFGDWQYINPNTTGLGGTAPDGRCIYIEPCSNNTAPCSAAISNPNTVPGIVQGLAKAASKFNMQTTCSSGTPCTGDGLYNSASTSQKFVLWITLPTPGTSPNSNCLP